MFPTTLDDLPNKWYKIKEAQGDTFNWKYVKDNFIKDFLICSRAGAPKTSNKSNPRFYLTTIKEEKCQQRKNICRPRANHNLQ